MAENSKIEWCNHTFNPWIGCQNVSPGCDNCYAEAMMDARFGRVQWGPKGTRKRTSAANWNKVIKWHDEARLRGVRYRVFCASLADVFDNKAPHEWRKDLFDLIRKTPRLDWLLLTKRPENMAAMLPADWNEGYPNVWLGVTTEDQERADRRIPILLNTPAAIRFVSYEPALGPVDFTNLCNGHYFLNAFTGTRWHDAPGDYSGRSDLCHSVDWIIAGGESGPDARCPRKQWFTSVRHQCAAAGLPFFFKQWGEWHHDGNNGVRIGKSRAGALLDGREHREFPGIANA